MRDLEFLRQYWVFAPGYTIKHRDRQDNPRLFQGGHPHPDDTPVPPDYTASTQIVGVAEAL